MKTLTPALIALTLCACGGTSARVERADPVVEVAPPSSEQARLFAEANDAFALDLWQQLRSADGNLAVSPASISVAFGMTWGGAGGRTAEQVATTMHFGADADAYHRAARAVLSTWNDSERDTYELSVANRLFGEQTYAWQDSFLALTRDSYGAPLEPMDFQGAAEPSRVRINTWVADRTQDRIQDLVPSGAITGDTRMVLTNAVYFRADWASQFEASATYPQEFHTGTATPSVPTMHQMARFGYGEADGVQLLEMPYSGGELSMLVALPAARDGLEAVESALDSERLGAWIDALEERNVNVSLPKFRVDPADPIPLGGHLRAMGMQDAFNPGAADFTRMADPSVNEGQPLFISAVFHKAFVAVDEEGTEAAAATAVVIAVESAMAEPDDQVPFVADHPFLFFIRDTRSGTILFMGRVADPS